jgi:hypothetical protein
MFDKQASFISVLLMCFAVFITLFWATHPGSLNSDLGWVSHTIMIIPHKL